MNLRQSPIRKCVGCGARRDKKELMRIVNNKNQIRVDPRGDLPGRGAYICPNLDCLKMAKEKNQLSKALKTKINEEIYQKLMEEIKNE
ncbi:MAG: RNase P modulator RnpM [Halanaerobiales bacterium]